MTRFSKPVQALATAASLWLASGFAVPSAAAQQVEPTATYALRGPISRDAADAFRQALTTASPRIRWLIVDSPGGDVEAALEVAELMRRERVSIFVQGLCVSSCANYLFLAAKSKVLGPGAIVAWHGSPASEHVDGLDALPPSERAQAEAMRRRLVRAERGLLAQLRVDPRLLCAGDRTIARAGALGWTMPIRSMAQFGVRSVVSLDTSRTIPRHPPGRSEPLLTLEPRPDCGRLYRALDSLAY